MKHIHIVCKLRGFCKKNTYSLQTIKVLILGLTPFLYRNWDISNEEFFKIQKKRQQKQQQQQKKQQQHQLSLPLYLSIYLYLSISHSHTHAHTRSIPLSLVLPLSLRHCTVQLYGTCTVRNFTERHISCMKWILQGYHEDSGVFWHYPIFDTKSTRLNRVLVEPGPRDIPVWYGGYTVCKLNV